MANRLDLHDEFIDILGTKDEKVSRVYYNPPESVKMEYPCIRYSLSGVDAKHANNEIYLKTNRYEVVVIDHDPDSDIYERIMSRFKMCRFDREYTANNLKHFALTLYY